MGVARVDRDLLEERRFVVTLRHPLATGLRIRIMASGFSHAFAAIALGKTGTGKRMPWKFWALAIASAVLPDADVIAFGFGIPYASMFGHRA